MVGVLGEGVEALRADIGGVQRDRSFGITVEEFEVAHLEAQIESIPGAQLGGWPPRQLEIARTEAAEIGRFQQ